MYEVIHYRSPKAEGFKEVMQLVLDQHSVHDDNAGIGRLLVGETDDARLRHGLMFRSSIVALFPFLSNVCTPTFRRGTHP
jgi:hypothetical protein